jgi:predicted CopG family antitoxin
MLKTLKISEETHKRLVAIGKKGETFDGIIVRLLDGERHD